MTMYLLVISESHSWSFSCCGSVGALFLEKPLDELFLHAFLFLIWNLGSLPIQCVVRLGAAGSDFKRSQLAIARRCWWLFPIGQLTFYLSYCATRRGWLRNGEHSWFVFLPCVGWCCLEGWSDPLAALTLCLTLLKLISWSRWYKWNDGILESQIWLVRRHSWVLGLRGSRIQRGLGLFASFRNSHRFV